MLAVAAVLVLLVARHIGLREFLLGFALPALPAVTVLEELARAHLSSWQQRLLFEAALEEQADTGAVTPEELRRHQDTQFHIRSNAPPLPERLYKIMRARNEAAMKFSSNAFAAALRHGVR